MAQSGWQARTGGGYAPEGPTKETYVVSTTGRDADEVVLRTLIGEYIEKGVNHGRKVYMKVQDKTITDYVDVLMYYWDARDGDSFEGWWFGNKLGGTQVWSHCKDSSLTPPGTGWKIPWDGAVRPTLMVKSKEAMLNAEAEEKLQILNDEVTRACAEANDALEQAQGASSSGLVSGLAEAEQLLAPQVVVIAELAKKVQDSQRFAVGDVVRGCEKLCNKVKHVHESLNRELSQVRSSQQKADLEQKMKASEDRDSKVLDELLPEAVERTNTAEDLVEKTVITSEMIDSCGDDADMVEQSIGETERSAKAAQSAIGEARMFLNAKLAISRRFVETVRERAAAELGKLQQQLQEATNKLIPLRNVRQEHNRRKEAQKVLEEVEEKMVLAEVDVDRAEEMVTMLNAESSPNKEGLLQAQTALGTAEVHINKAMELYEAKVGAATGIPKEELSRLGPRGEAARKRVAQLRASLKEAGERITIEGYLEEAASKVEAVTTLLAKIEDGQPQPKEGEEISIEDTLASVKMSEQSAANAQTASSMARMFIQMKLLEVKRFSSGPSAEANAKLTGFQKQLEAAMKRLAETKTSLSRRKWSALVKEADTRVASAEARVEALKEATGFLADDAKLMAMSADEIREASEKTSASEKAANKALAEVKSFITSRQIEAKGKDAISEVGSELIRFQTRLSTAQSEVAKQKKLFASVEQRLSVKRLLEEAEKKLKETEDKVAKSLQAVASLEALEAEAGDAGKDSDKQIKETELLVQEAQIASRTTSRYLEAQSRSQGFAKDAIAKLEPRAKACQEKVQSASAQMKERSEGIFVRSIIREAEAKLAECDAAFQKAVEIEQPFLQSEDGVVPDKAALVQLEKAVQAAHGCATSSKTFLSMRRLSIKRLSEATIQSSNEALNKLEGTVDDTIKKIKDMRMRSIELKKVANQAAGKAAGKGAARRSG